VAHAVNSEHLGISSLDLVRAGAILDGVWDNKGEHGRIESNFDQAITAFARCRKLGKVLVGEVGIFSGVGSRHSRCRPLAANHPSPTAQTLAMPRFRLCECEGSTEAHEL
jgi:hypothetical protein